MKRINYINNCNNFRRCFGTCEIASLIFVFTTANVLTRILVNIADYQAKKFLQVNSDIIKYINPNTNLYVADNNIKDQIDNIIFMCNENTNKKLTEYRNKIHINTKNKKNYILLYGLPGSGKTHFASYLALQLNKKLVSLNLSSLKSPWVGQEGFALNNALSTIDKNHSNDVVIIDEIDSLITHRTYNSSADKDHASTINIMLSWMDGINTDDQNKIILFTTNKYNELSTAFIDRITYKLNFSFLSKDTLKQFWKVHLVHLSNDELDKIATLEINSFRICNNILEISMINKIKNEDSTPITAEDICNVYMKYYKVDNYKYVL